MIRYFILSFFSLLLLTGKGQNVTVSGMVKDKATKLALPFATLLLKTEKDSAFVSGTISNEEGRFTLSGLRSGSYVLFVTLAAYKTSRQTVFIGSLSDYLDLKTIELEELSNNLEEVEIGAKQDAVSGRMDKKTYSVEDNISQSGGSVLQTLQNLPGITVQEGKVQLRGNDKVAVLVDGKQTALTGFGNQYGLDNIPSSAIEKIEIINNPSSKYDANGNAGVINIVMKKSQQQGFSGKAGLAGGLGALWIKKENLPGIRPQYQYTPKVNPSLSLNYRRNKWNTFLQTDYLYTETLNKNEFVTRYYDNGTVIRQQTKRNRNTHFGSVKAGADYSFNDRNALTISALYGTEKILDHGDEPFFNPDLSERLRLWQFLEDELKTTVMASSSFQHKFSEAGHLLNLGFNYTFHRENEKYFFDNILPAYTSHEAFKLLSDEQVADLNLDYIRPLRYGRIETGLKFRRREIPANMQFYPGFNSPLDVNAGGKATYREIIPAAYANYVFENKKLETELGLRVEYVNLQYDVAPGHPTYKSDGYTYSQPFPNLRFAYKLNEQHKLSLFYNRRVDRPNEVDIRIFPKYDDAEIIKVGNPGLKPQFTSSFELGYKALWKNGYWYSALFHKISDGTITRISTTVPGSTLIYAVFQNAGRSYNSGLEAILSLRAAKWYDAVFNVTVYHNQIDAFTSNNLYPQPNTFSADKQEIYSGTFKWNSGFHFPKAFDAQLSAAYLAPDIIPQGKMGPRFSLDLGVKKKIQKGKGELFLNATDLLNTLVIKKEIFGENFHYTSNDYYETQVIRLGYSYKF